MLAAFGRLEDRRLFRLEIEVVSPFGRRRHEHELQVAVLRLRRRLRRADTPGDDEEPHLVERQRAGVVGQQLPRRVEQGGFGLGAVAVDPDFEPALARHGGPGRGPVLRVEPGEHLPADCRERRLVVGGRRLIVARRPVLEARRRVRDRGPRLGVAAGYRAADVRTGQFDHPDRHGGDLRQRNGRPGNHIPRPTLSNRRSLRGCRFPATKRGCGA